MNLLYESWIPVIRQSGKQEKIAPWQIVETDDPILELNAPRPDFNGALMELFIGLLQTTVAPDSHNQWVDWLESPPSVDILKEKLVPYKKAFEFMGDSPIFMQDFEEIDGRTNPIGFLMINAPTENTLKDNRDFFVKRKEVETVCPSCAVLALYTMQSYAPGGGRGHRASLRGGGPLTTLVIIDPIGSRLQSTLWRNLWLNVIERSNFDGFYGISEYKQISDIFPWMVPTRTSENKTGQDTHIQQVNPLQMYWGMPRRIKLLWREESAQCDLCGCQSDHNCREYITKNYGVNYTGVWQHPLSPHYIDSKTGEALSVHAQQDGLSYRNWLGWAQSTVSIKSARVVELFNISTKRKLENEQFRLNVFGYEMDKKLTMKARGWHQAIYPMYQIEDESLRQDFVKCSQKLINSAIDVAGFAQSCIKEAWFKRPKDVRGDTGFIKEAFYQRTEQIFYQSLNKLLTALPEQNEIPVFKNWYEQIKKAAIDLFDYWAARGDLAVSDPHRIATAHKKLINLLHGKKFLAGLGISN